MGILPMFHGLEARATLCEGERKIATGTAARRGFVRSWSAHSGKMRENL